MNNCIVQYLLFSIRAIGHSVVMLLIPLCIAAMVLIPLASLNKSSIVEMKLLTTEIGFDLKSALRSGQDVELIKSMSTNSLKLWIESITLDVASLIDERTGKAVLKEQKVVLRAKSDQSWIAFKSDKPDIHLISLYLDQESRVELRRRGNKVGIKLIPNEWLNGNISLPTKPVRLYAFDCDILREDGTPVADVSYSQKRFLLSSAQTSTAISYSVSPGTSGKVYIESVLDYGEYEKDNQNSFSEYLRITRLEFLPGSGEKIIPISEGWVKFRGINKDKLDIESEFVSIPEEDAMDLITLGIRPEAFEIVMSGRVGSLRVGKVPHREEEVLPSLLEWLYENQKLGIIIAILVWISGTVLGSVKLMNELRKEGG